MLTAEASRKRSLGNGIVNVPIKYKWRKVSARRDFPEGCGRFAPRIPGGQTGDAAVDTVENLKVGAESAAILEPDPVKQSGISIPNLLKSSLLAKLSNLSEPLKSKTVQMLEIADKVEAVKPTENAELAALFHWLETLKSKTTMAFDTLDQVEALEIMKNLEHVKRVLSKSLDQKELLDMSKSLEHETMSSLGLQSLSDLILPDTLEPSKVSDQPQPFVPVIEAVDEKLFKEYPPLRRISVTRDFPPGCVSKIPHVSEEYQLKTIASFENKRADDKNLNVEHRPCKETVREQRLQELEPSMIPSGFHTSSDKVARNIVKKTLHLFQVTFKDILKEEEAKSKEQGKRIWLVPILAANCLKKEHKWVNSGKPIFGSVPGVEVGDEFHFRVELVIIGLHRQFQSGIDYAKEGGKFLATSIVASVGYGNDMDSSGALVYSGQGGKSTNGDKKPEDQKLERGNLSLKNSMDARTVVRVIRGCKGAKGSRPLYTYDGLYLVEKYWQEKGRYGTTVFKFKLRRILGQPELALKETKSETSKFCEDLCVFDISQGKERMPIRAVNTIDDEKPPPFTYITNMIYSKCYKYFPTPQRGCDCTDGCLDSRACLCAVKNGGDIPFNHNGDIVEAKPLIYECGPSCNCPPSCHNRVSQHGIKFQLEIFKTKLRGWGVRSQTFIPCGSFICEYTGELLHDKEAEQRFNNDEYLFEIGCNYNDPSDGLSVLRPELKMNSSCEVVEEVGFTIDAALRGNVGRFINHSCSPNLYAQNVLYDHDDNKMPHIMLFASENIPSLQELTYHYNYKIDQVYDSEGNIKKKSCYCGSPECTGRLY